MHGFVKSSALRDGRVLDHREYHHHRQHEIAEARVVEPHVLRQIRGDEIVHCRHDNTQRAHAEGKTLGIVGLGKIGSQVAEIGKGHAAVGASRSTLTKRCTTTTANPAPAVTIAESGRSSVTLARTKNSTARNRSTASEYLLRFHCARARASSSSC
ncbi:MAG: hypothetical protein EBT64_08260 [Gammaproteobacteria bacterium]|nr:hypothetical protein [Gammaproteobacteria bacterium]